MFRCVLPQAGLIERTHPSKLVPQIRHVSNSPYGRTHVWKHRRPKLPNPIVPMFPQHVTLSDGSTYTHYTTSPRSSVRLTRDVTNHPLWNYGRSKDGSMFEDEDGSTGRLGRFRRKFEEFSKDMDWITESEEAVEALRASEGKEK